MGIVNSFFASRICLTKHDLRLLFKLGVIAPSGRHVCERGRLAGAQAWQTERWNERNSVRGLTPQRSQMRYNGTGACVRLKF